MARNGSGVYSLPAGNPVTTGTTISSTWANTTLNDISSALTTSISSDGQTTPSANLPMGNYLHTGVGNATVRTSYAAAGQVQDGSFMYLTSITGTDTIVATAALGMTAYATGQTFRFISAGANTTTSVTININGIGAKNLTKTGSVALAVGDIVSGAIVQIVYDGTQFQVTGVTTSLIGLNNTWTGTNTWTQDSFFTSTGALQVPVGTTAQQPTGANGKIRYNSTTGKYEGYSSAAWSSLGGGATGGGSDTVFIQNSKVITTSYSIPSTQNAMSTGPLTINSGVTVTVPSGSKWVVL
jgi:hypothetical protein